MGETLLLAVIGAAHGIRGEVRVKSFAFEALENYSPLRDAQGRIFNIKTCRYEKSGYIIRFEGINTRNDAELLNGKELFVEKSQLPALEEEEFYYSDLVGLSVFEAGQEIGKVLSVQDFGAGDMLEIMPLEGTSFYISFTKQNVPLVSVSQKRIEIVRPLDV